MALAAESAPAAAGGVAIRVRGLSHTYRTAGGPLSVLDGLSFDAPAGAHLALTGPSGAGKTTLLSLLGGLERPQAGEVLVGDVDLRHLGGRRLADYRRDTVGFVFQHFGLLDLLTARENIEMALALAGVGRRHRTRRAGDLLDAVGLGDRAEHRPGALSGGERQRVAIARALANSPRLLLADEPTGNLDGEAAIGVLDLLDELRREHGSTLVVVTHNPTVAARASIHGRMTGGHLEAAWPGALAQ